MWPTGSGETSGSNRICSYNSGAVITNICVQITLICLGEQIKCDLLVTCMKTNHGGRASPHREKII